MNKTKKIDIMQPAYHECGNLLIGYLMRML